MVGTRRSLCRATGAAWPLAQSSSRDQGKADGPAGSTHFPVASGQGDFVAIRFVAPYSPARLRGYPVWQGWEDSAKVLLRRRCATGGADVAQLVAHHLAKVRVAGSNPVVRSEAARY